MQNDYQLYRPLQPSYFLDLFSGIGGFHLGAQWAGLHFDGYYYSEVDHYAIKVYAKQFPAAIGLGDITKVDGHALPKGNWIIAGGFPCQDISVAGKGAGLAGARSGLWYEYARLIGELRPRYAIMENVGALTFRGLDAVLGSLAEIGYDAEWQDIRASDVGAPHRRERIWIVAYPELHGRATCEERGSTKEAIRQEQTGEGKSLDFTGSGSISAAEGNVAYPSSADEQTSKSTDGENEQEHRGKGSRTNVAYHDSEHGLRRPEPQQSASAGGKSRDQSAWGGAEGNVADAESSGYIEASSERKLARGRSCIDRQHARAEPWSAEPDVGRVAHGVPSRVDRLKCLGNSIVPQIAQLIFEQPAFDEWRNNAE